MSEVGATDKPPPPPEGWTRELWAQRWATLPKDERRQYALKYLADLKETRRRARALLDEHARTAANHARTMHGYPCCKYAGELPKRPLPEETPRCGGAWNCRACATDAAATHSVGRGKLGTAPLELHSPLER